MSEQDAHPEMRCQECGGPNIHAWFVDSPLWNEVYRGPDGHDRFGIVCPVCFAADYEALHPGQAVWELRLDNPDRTEG